METSRDSYQQVQIHSENENLTTKPWKIMQRQVLVSSAVWSSFFTLGLLFGTPTVYIAQRRREENSTEAISIEMASWISSAHTYSAIPFFFIMAALSKHFGRKKTYLIACSTSFIGFMTIYLSTSVIEILIGECILGALLACDFIICGMVLTEYTSSKYRGFFLTFKSATFAWGILVANLIGIFIDWRPIALLACICSAYSFIVGLTWPESPYWLISNKDYNACSESHYWLKGKNEESKRELKELIKAHQELIEVKIERTRQHPIVKLIKNLISKTFYRPFTYSILMASLYYFSGKMACNVYAIQIIKSVIDNDSVANTGTLIVDAVCVIKTKDKTIVEISR
ncbi:unnamed protein product [Colias eurytheme]|nr:unnamed protein product [Colias eurytheme]